MLAEHRLDLSDCHFTARYVARSPDRVVDSGSPGVLRASAATAHAGSAVPAEGRRPKLLVAVIPAFVVLALAAHTRPSPRFRSTPL